MDTRKTKWAAENDADNKKNDSKKIKIGVESNEQLEAWRVDAFKVKKYYCRPTCAPKIPNFGPNFGHFPVRVGEN